VRGGVKPAFAGSWSKVTIPGTVGSATWKTAAAEYYEGETHQVFHSNSPWGYESGDTTTDWVDNQYNRLFAFDQSEMYSCGGDVSNKVSGKVRDKFHWNRNLLPSTNMPDPNDNPPNTLLLKVTLEAWATASSISSGDEFDPHRDLEKEHAIVSASIDGKSLISSGEYEYFDWALFQCSTRNEVSAINMLVKVNTNGQDDVWGPWVEVSAEGKIDGGRSYTPQGGSTVQITGDSYACFQYYSAVVDDFRMVITRPGAINERMDADGAVHGDTTYSYAEYVRSTAWDYQYNDQTFVPSLPAGWHYGGAPSVTGQWSHSPSTSLDQQQSSAASATYRTELGGLHFDNYPIFWGGNYGWDGTPKNPTQTTITFNATNNTNNATSSAQYFLTLHEPVEKTNENVEDVSIETPLWGSAQSGGNALMRVDGFTAAGMVQVSAGHAKTQGWTVAVDSDLGFGEIAKVLGVSATYESSKESNITGTFLNTEDVPVDYYTYPQIRHHYNRHHVYYRHFKPEGEHLIPEQARHRMIWDEFTSDSIVWHAPIPNSEPTPVFDPQAPPPTLPEP
jgi:hypothetical protein